jgi:hypothetical protein
MTEEHDALQTQLQLLGVTANKDLIVDLLKRSATVNEAIEYYFNNQHQFADKKYTALSENNDQTLRKEEGHNDKMSYEEILCQMGYKREIVQHVLQRCSSLEAAVHMMSLDLDNSTHTKEPNMTCPICGDDYAASLMITLNCLPNPHRFCSECFVGYCSHKITEAQVQSEQLVCPARLEDSGKICGTEITVFEVQAHLPPEIYEKYLRFITRSYCDQKNMRRCPKCNDWYIDIDYKNVPEEEWKDITCGNCNHHFCGKCGERPHKATKDQDIDCAGFAKWIQENDKSDESFKDYRKANNIFACPTCGEAGQLGDGCKYLYCRCNGHFCALCGVKLTESEHTSHFFNAPHGDKCLNKN